MNFEALLALGAFVAIPVVFAYVMDLLKSTVLSFCPQPPVAAAAAPGSENREFSRRERPPYRQAQSAPAEASQANTCAASSGISSPVQALSQDPTANTVDLQTFDYTEFRSESSN